MRTMTQIWTPDTELATAMCALVLCVVLSFFHSFVVDTVSMMFLQVLCKLVIH